MGDDGKVRIVLMLVLAAALMRAEPAKILYVTTSAGYRHDCLPVTVEVLRGICERTGVCELTHTEDTSEINEEGLRAYRAVLFYTSGELPLDTSQRQALLAFVVGGGAFAGFHSATDTLYTWPEYGGLVGAYFDGHPWTQVARVLVSAQSHPIVSAIPSPWELTEEYYQFRSRQPMTVLLSLDTSSVDLQAPEVRASEFPLAWVRPYGGGRVFYSALGHFEDTWRNPVFQRLIENALRWMLAPAIAPDGIGNAATIGPAGMISPGTLMTIYGSMLTASGRAESGYVETLAGTSVSLGGRALPLLYAGPLQINAYVPLDVIGQPCIAVIGNPCVTQSVANLEVRHAAGAVQTRVFFTAVTPGIFRITASGRALTVWGTGFGSVRTGDDGLQRMEHSITARVAGADAAVSFAGLAPGIPGLYQINISLPDGVSAGVQRVELTVDGQFSASSAVMVP